MRREQIYITIKIRDYNKTENMIKIWRIINYIIDKIWKICHYLLLFNNFKEFCFLNQLQSNYYNLWYQQIFSFIQRRSLVFIWKYRCSAFSLLRFRRGTVALVLFSIEFYFLGCGISKTFDIPTSRIWQTLFWKGNSDSSDQPSRTEIQKCLLSVNLVCENNI